jgi:glutaminase
MNTQTIKAGVLVAALFAFGACAAQGAPAPQFQAQVDEAYGKYKDLKDGKNADYIPILATIPSELFGVVLATRDGKLYTAGDVHYEFSIQSVSKPFTAALIMAEQGPKTLREKIGVEPTGLAFNSKLALEIYPGRSVNPLVNAGAIAAVSLVEAASEEDRWERVLGNIEAFAGRKLTVQEEVYKSEYETAGATAASPTCCSTTGGSTVTRRRRCGSTRGSAPSV